MAQLEKTLDTLDYKHWYYETAKAAGTCKIHEQMAKEDIPQRMRRKIKILLFFTVKR